MTDQPASGGRISVDRMAAICRASRDGSYPTGDVLRQHVRWLLGHIDALQSELDDIRPKYEALRIEVDAHDQANTDWLPMVTITIDAAPRAAAAPGGEG